KLSEHLPFWEALSGILFPTRALMVPFRRLTSPKAAQTSMSHSFTKFKKSVVQSKKLTACAREVRSTGSRAHKDSIRSRCSWRLCTWHQGWPQASPPNQKCLRKDHQLPRGKKRC